MPVLCGERLGFVVGVLLHANRMFLQILRWLCWSAPRSRELLSGHFIDNVAQCLLCVIPIIIYSASPFYSTIELSVKCV